MRRRLSVCLWSVLSAAVSVPTAAAGRLSRLLKELCATRRQISEEDAAAAEAEAVLFEQCSEVSTMIRTVVSQALFRLNRLPARHFSAAAIPAPNTQPDVHYNKVGRLNDQQLDTGQLRNQQVCVCVCFVLLLQTNKSVC